MANAFNDLSQVLAQCDNLTLPPQSFTTTGAGAAVNVATGETAVINARLLLGDANTLTSLVVKMQAAVDDGNGAPDSGSWVDIPDAVFPTVTVDPTTAGAAPATLVFQLPQALNYSSKPYTWLRAYCTLVGTSILVAMDLLFMRKYDQENNYVAAPGNDGNNVIN